jgi:Bifunctional DNA primase/polymerase, N-terminal
MTPLGGALRAAARGWHVFPVGGRDEPKAPRPGWRWAEQNTTDQPRVRAWMRGGTAYGIACGPSALVVIDLDVAKPGTSGRGGQAAFAALCDRAGSPWPVTYTVLTPSGGRHLYFRADPQRKVINSAGRLGLGIDVRAAGGYVVGAGSVIPAGEYHVEGSVLALASLPPWLPGLLGPPRITSPGPQWRAGADGLAAWVAELPEGNRNAGLFWAACRAAGEGADPWALVPGALRAGLSDHEARQTVASAMRRYQ